MEESNAYGGIRSSVSKDTQDSLAEFQKGKDQTTRTDQVISEPTQINMQIKKSGTTLGEYWLVVSGVGVDNALLTTFNVQIPDSLIVLQLPEPLNISGETGEYLARQGRLLTTNLIELRDRFARKTTNLKSYHQTHINDTIS